MPEALQIGEVNLRAPVGSIIVVGADGRFYPLAAGSNTQILHADSSEFLGVKWVNDV